MFVLDCSVLAKSFLDEDRSDDFRAWLEKTMAQGQEPLVPALAVSEVARVIQRQRPDLSLDDQIALWRVVLLGCEVAPADPVDDAVWNVASEGLTYDDAEYVALARQHGATLVTADAKQLAVARKLKLKVLDFVPRVAKAGAS